MGQDNNKKKLPFRKCVGVMVLNREGKVWAGHRCEPSGGIGELTNSDKRWQMPQGGIDKGEDKFAAAKRELFEETGMHNVEMLARSSGWIKYELPEELIGTALKGKYRGQKMAWFAFRFLGTEDEINITHPPEGAPVEFDRWDWVDMYCLPELIVDFKKPVYEKVVGEFRHLIEN